MPHDSDISDVPTKPVDRQGSTLGGGVVLVEQDPELQTRLARSLIDHGARVVATGSADAALAVLSSWSPDLVLVSDALPGPGGLELARRIREEHPEARVVLMTDGASRDSDASVGPGRWLGRLAKPFSLDAIVELLRTLAPPRAELAPAE